MPREGLMKRIPFSSAATPAALVAILMFALPGGAAAQGARSRGSAPVQGQAVQRGEGQSGQGQSAQGQSGQGAGPQGGTQRTAPPQRSAEPQRSVVAPQRNPPIQNVAPQRVVRPSVGTAVPRSVPRAIRPNNDNPVYRPNYGPSYGPTYPPAYRPAYRPVYPAYRPVYRPNYGAYYRPYYTFQPRFHLNFGLWVGVPVAYPYYMYPAASYPYAYTYPQPVYPVTGSTATAVNAAGGLSFDISPSDARIYVDEQYFGIAAQYTPTEPPLSLAPGRHHVEIHASGFEVIAFDVDILPGQVIPYQGDLQRF